MDELLFVSQKAKDAGLSDFQIKDLRFAKTDANGVIIGIIDSYKLNLVKFKGEIVIIMFNE